MSVMNLQNGIQATTTFLAAVARRDATGMGIIRCTITMQERWPFV